MGESLDYNDDWATAVKYVSYPLLVELLFGKSLGDYSVVDTAPGSLLLVSNYSEHNFTPKSTSDNL